MALGTWGRTALAALAAGAGLGLATQAAAEEATDLSKLSIEELGNIEVTSVSKRAESVGQAAAADRGAPLGRQGGAPKA